MRKTKGGYAEQNLHKASLQKQAAAKSNGSRSTARSPKPLISDPSIALSGVICTHTDALKPVSCLRDEVHPEVCEQEVRQWLKSLSLHLPVDASTGSGLGTGSPLEDPLRNGVMLCSLVHRLLQLESQDEVKSGSDQGAQKDGKSGTPNLAFNKRPMILKQARENLELAMATLRCRNIPSVYLYSTEQILKGHEQIIWGLLYHLMQIFPAVASCKPEFPVYSSSNMQGYTAAHNFRLEQSLLHWIASMGVLYITDPPPDDTTTPTSTPTSSSMQVLHVPPEDMESPYVFPYIRNGTLLCDLVSAIEGPRLTGVFRNPKIKGTCLANLRKAMKALRQKKGMSKVYLDMADLVYNGDKVVILALLEDMHRYYNGIPPRTHLIQKGDAPYIVARPTAQVSRPNANSGKIGNSAGSSSANVHLQATELWASVPYPSSFNSFEPPTAPPEPFLPSTQLQTSLLPSPSKLKEQHDQQSGRPGARPQPMPSTNLQMQKDVSAGRFASPQPVRPSPSVMQSLQMQGLLAAASGWPGSGASSTPLTSTDASPSEGSATGLGRNTSGSSAFTHPINPHPGSAGAVTRSSSAPSVSSQGQTTLSRATPDLQGPSERRPSSRLRAAPERRVATPREDKSHVHTLTKWLQFLGIYPTPCLVGPKLEAFYDGTLLCHIVGILSHETLKGVEWKPKSKASMLHNLHKAIEVLQKNKHIMLDWLFLAQDLHEGKPEAVISLLSSMKRAYHYFVSTVAKTPGEGPGLAAGVGMADLIKEQQPPYEAVRHASPGMASSLSRHPVFTS